MNISRFKQSALQTQNLEKIQKEFSRLARYVISSPSKVQVKHCYVCESSRRQKAGTVYGIDYLKCRDCSHFYSNIRLSQDGMEDYYKKNQNYSADYANPSTYRYRLKEIALPKVQFVQAYVKTKRKRWLDVGSGIGDMVVAAKRKGFDAQGIEISEKSARFAKKVFGIDISSETLKKVLEREGEGAFDVVSFFGVLEHIPNLKEQVALTTRLVSKNGLLVIEVPNANSISTLSDFLYPDQVTRHMYPPFHIMAFTKKSLFRFVRSAGFKPAALWYFGLDFYNLLIHWGMQSERMMRGPLADFLISCNNQFQEVIDRNEMSDEMILVSRKK